MFKQRPFAADAANATRLGRRHLADEGLVQRLVARRHALDVEKRFVARGPHIAGIFAERTSCSTAFGGISPSRTISAVAGTSKGMVSHGTRSTGSPRSAPATANSSSASDIFDTDT